MSANAPPIFQLLPDKSEAITGKRFTWPWLQWFLAVQQKLTAPVPVAPAGFTSSFPGTPGQVFRDPAGTFFYVCVATNTWARTALSAF
jgi:hypothetical protein